MRRFIELSGDLPRPIIGDYCIEIESLLSIFPGKILKCTKRYAIIEADRIEEIAYRLAMAHYVYRYIGTPEDFEELRGKYVVYRSKLASGEISAKEALEIAKSIGIEPDLNADRDLYVILTEDGIHIATHRIPTGRRFLYQRMPARRPVHNPPTLDPYKARFLVNLSRVPAGERLLDPFCGFGSILLEAYDIGSKPIGIDIKKKALEGTIKNFEHFFSARPELILGDSTRLKVKANHVATDPPRGKMLKGIDLRYKFLENTDAERIAAVLGPYHDVGNPIYYGVLFEGKKRELRFVVYHQ